MIENVDQRSKDYGDIRDLYRPGHADYAYDAEIRRARLSRRRAHPPRARPPRASRPAAWRAKCWATACTIRGALVQIGPHKIDRARWDWAEAREQPVLVPGSPTPPSSGKTMLDADAQGRLLRSAPSSK